MAKVSIITRTRNRIYLLERALNDILKQTFDDWELILVNNGEKKPFEDLVSNYEEKFSNRLKVKHVDGKGGLGRLCNAGVRIASGKYINIHDDDDTWKPNFLERTVGYLEEKQDPRTKGVLTRVMNIYEEVGEDYVKKVGEEPHNSELRVVDLVKIWSRNFFPPISFVYENSVFDEVGYYDDDLPVLEDWDLTIRILEKYNIEVIQEYLANYHYRSNSTSSDLENSIFTAEKEHFKIDRAQFYESHLRNRYLRKDFEKGMPGIGTVINFSEAHIVKEEIQALHGIVRRVKESKLVKILKKSFG